MVQRLACAMLCGISAFSTVRANDTVFVSGALQHDGLLDWTPVMYHSNSYLDLSVHWQRESPVQDPSQPTDSLRKEVKESTFRELRATTRLELTRWPMPGYERDFGGYGMSHLSVAASFTWGEITVGDVYGQFGSGLILNLHEDRALGIDGALRGAKISVEPYQGIRLTALGGKQRRYWNCYTDKAFGWNYGRDAAIGGDVEVDVFKLASNKDSGLDDISWTIGGSYVSKYEADDTIMVYRSDGAYRYRFPKWVGAGDVRTQLHVKGFDVLIEYARKANDPTTENNYSYRDGEALLLSAGYSRKGLAVLAQVKRSENMSFRSERLRTGLAGRLNHMPAFAQQHTYALASLSPYATRYAEGEWAFQAELRYTWARKTKMGGRYGTSLKLSAAHIRGLAAEGSWAVNTSEKGEYYTDVNVELNKRISKRWWLNAMLMYQTYNRDIMEGHGELVRSGIAVVDTRVQINNNVSMRSEIQYLYTPHYQGQWIFALYELSLYKHWTVSGQWMYNIGHASEANNEHYYTAGLTFNYGAHRANLGYTKTREGFNCSGGVCRYVPKMEGVSVNYSFTF